MAARIPNRQHAADKNKLISLLFVLFASRFRCWQTGRVPAASLNTRRPGGAMFLQVVDSLTSFCKSAIVTSVLKMQLVALALTLVGLPASSVAQSGSVGIPSAQQKLVLSYFHDVLDGGKIDLVENMFQPD
jgi:hypothetical protein